MNARPPSLFNLALAALLLAGAAGCGGSGHLSKVTGIVTLDGEPLPHARVLFQNNADGNTILGRTDPEGRYELFYSSSIEGAPPGDYTVRITTAAQGDPDAEPPVPSSPEKLPRKYHADTELTATVETGRQKINFELESGS